KNDRKQRKQKTVVTPLSSHADESLAVELRHLRLKALPGVAKEIEHQLLEVSNLQEQLARLEQELTAVPAAETITPLFEERDHLLRQLQLKQAELNVHDEKVRVLEREQKEADEALKRAFDSDVDAQMTSEEGRRVLQHSAAVRETLDKFRVTVIHRHA